MSSHLADTRRETIAARLREGQPVVAAALAGEFGVSEDSIRRDLRALAAEGRCRRVYGGALPQSPASGPMAARSREDGERKLALARAGATLIRAGEFLFLDSGSTNLALAGLLPTGMGLTVATNCVRIAAMLCERTDLALIVIGGTVDPHIGGCVDASAVMALQDMNIDHCFAGACAISTELGLCTFDGADAIFKRALLAASRRASLLVTTQKLGTTAPHRVSPLSRIETIVLENHASSQHGAALSQAGPAILFAAPMPASCPSA